MDLEFEMKRRVSTEVTENKLLTQSGAPGVIRTRDPLLRRQMLYPTELRAPRMP